MSHAENGRAGFHAVNDILVDENGQIGSTLGLLIADATMDAALFAMTSTGSDPKWLLWAPQLIPDDEASIGFAAHRTADPVSYGAMLQLHHLTPCDWRRDGANCAKTGHFDRNSSHPHQTCLRKVVTTCVVRSTTKRLIPIPPGDDPSKGME